MWEFLLKSVGIYNKKRLEYGKNFISRQKCYNFCGQTDINEADVT